VYDKCDAFVTDTDAWLKDYEDRIITSEDRAFYTKLVSTRKLHNVCRDKMINMIKAQNADEELYAYLDQVYLPQYRILRDQLLGQITVLSDSSIQIGADVKDVMHTSRFLIDVGILVAVMMSLGIGYVIIHGTNKVLNRSISSIDEGASQVAAAATEVSSASNMLAEGASEQAASLEETSSSLEEISSMTAHNASSAQDAKSLADEMRAAADNSTDQMKQMQTAMDAIKESSSDISQIIKTIDEIAFQTNILALNAAVEAARAGEAGAGFAVVAEEVRNLAQRSANAAKETSGKIEGAIRNSENGVAISARVAVSLGTIVEKARSMNLLVSEIATASQEQDRGISQLTVAVSEMDKVTQSNAANAEETASSSEELNAHADTLKDIVIDLIRLVRSDEGRRESSATRASVSSRPGSDTSRSGNKGGSDHQRFLT